MTVTTLQPNGTHTNNNVSVVGAATAHAATSDGSDSTYVSSFDTAAVLAMRIADFTLPAGDVMKHVKLRLRLAKSGTTGTITVRLRLTESISGQSSLDIPGTRQDHTVTWTSPADIVSGSALILTADEVDDLFFIVQSQFGVAAEDVRLYEVFIDVTHVDQPVVSADSPTGTLTTTTFPTIEWSNTLDDDGGAQTSYEVKIYTDTEYNAVGFDPDTSTPTAESGVTAGADGSWQVDEALADDTYRAYVRVAQTVNGELHWSDWDFTGFTVLVDKPAVPTFTATADDTNARITLSLSSNSGDATTDAFEVQRSLDSGATWQTVRQLDAGAITPDGSGDATLYDYEAPQATTVSYRGRALHDYGDDDFAGSDWAEDSASWDDGNWWIKHPHRPDLNMTVIVRDIAQTRRAGRQGIFQPLGSASVVVVSDKRSPAEGMIVLRLDSADDQDALDDLLDAASPTLMIQGPVSGRPPEYVVFREQARGRIVPMREDATRVFDELQYVVVGSPPGDVALDDWPS